MESATTELPPSSNRMMSRETVGKAVDALLKWMRTRAEKEGKAQLLDPDDDLLYLVLTLKRIPPKSRINPYRVPLPHSLYDPAATSACLFLDDRDRARAGGSRRSSSSLTAAAVLDRARSLSLPLADAIPLSALAADYRPFEARRRLVDSHDLFFADRAILPLLPRLLGKNFFKKKKLPLALELSRSGWPEQLRACLCSTFLHVRSGSCSSLKIGRLSMDRDQIVDNVIAAIEGAIAHVPKKWANVRSFHVRAINSVALPIYQAVPELGLKIEVPVPRLPQKKEEMEEDVDEPTGERAVVQEEEKPEMMNKMEEETPKKGSRVHEVPYMDAANDLDLGDENFLNGVDEEEEEEGEATMAERKNKKKTNKIKTKEGVEVRNGKQKKKGKREDSNQNDREEEGDGKGNGNSMVAVAKKKEGEVKKEKDKKGRKGSGADDEVRDENCDADIPFREDEEEEVGVGKKMNKLKKDDLVKKGKKGKRSKNDGGEDSDHVHRDDGAEGDNGMTAEKKVMKAIEENEKVKKEKDGIANKKSKANRMEDKEVKKIKKSKVRHETD